MNQWNLQVALVDRLLADEAVKSFVDARVYDDVPQNTAFPYVVVGDDTSIDWSQDCSLGAESTITIHVWSRYSGRKEAKQIMTAIYETLNRKELTISGAQNVICHFDYEDTFLDPDGATRHGVIRLRLLITHS